MAKSEKPKVVYTSGALTMRLIIGIFSILMSLVIGFQSCAATFGEALSDAKTSDGMSGSIVGFFVLAAGIVTIAARKTKGGTITSIVLYILSGIIGLVNSSYYKDLKVWGVIALIFGILLIISLRMKLKDSPNENEQT